VSVDQFELRPAVGTELWSFASIRERSEHSIVVDIQIFNDRGETVGAISGSHWRRADGKQVKDYGEWLHEFHWRPQNRAQLSRPRISPAVIAESLRPRLETLWDAHKLDSLDDFRSKLSQVCLASIARGLHRLGWEYIKGETFTAESAKNKLQVIDRHARLLR